MSKTQLHTDLKIAVEILGTSISEFGRSLTKPDGSSGLSHTAVIRVAQGKEHTPWIKHEIYKLIAKARKKDKDNRLSDPANYKVQKQI
ncbi:hypothetical protein [Halalkalibaculum sp. DA384]|uniref:hypothetical protein n=1 Tax=Halalkalibaculum sp. DA384 TaxID=3373606 RepID=UPI0037553E32